MGLSQVVARLEGGLGNQLFQYAAARSLADRLGCGLLLDVRGLAINGDRPYQLHLYKVRAELTPPELLHALSDWQPSRWRRLRSSLSQRFAAFSYPTYWPKTFAYDSSFEQLKQPVFMVGYWQTEQYFAWNRSQLLKDLALVDDALTCHDLRHRINNTCSVSLHVRRGDYVSNPAAASFHGLCDVDYYKRAVAHFEVRYPELEVFVFSDEPAWARENLHLGVPTHVVDAHTPEQGHLDLALMQHCKHHIIANSSFSWWGAWLCENAGQQVVAPKRWFADAGVDTSDVIPAHWVQM